MSYRLVDLIQQLGRPHVFVVGDLILDRYIWGDAERVSQEAPVILLREQRQETRLGGAANVANLLCGLEADVTIAGVVGNDDDGRALRQQMIDAGVDCSAVLCDESRPTTVKQRFIGLAQHRHPHQILRVDREVRTPLSRPMEDELLNAATRAMAEYDAVLISDYAKGLCTPRVLEAIIATAREAGKPVIVDPAAAAVYSHYRGATAITPNRSETANVVRQNIDTLDDAFAAGRQLCLDLELDACFITLDSDGIALSQPHLPPVHLPTRKREVYDITGAGDMVLATIGIGAAAGIAPPDLARLANVAGGLEVEQVGVVCITRKQMLADVLSSTRQAVEKLCTLEEASRHIAARKQLGQRVVLTNGCFDLLHLGHVSYLQQAAREGDCLIVAVNSDAGVRRLDKGSDRPVFSQQTRCEMLAALEAVDYVIVFDEETPHNVLATLQPHLLVKGGTYTAEEIVGKELVESYGGQVKPLGEIPGVSTTDILARIRGDAPFQQRAA